MGRNGAGKTTLLRLIMGEQQPTSGAVTIGAECTLGYLPQTMRVHDTTSLVEETAKAFEADELRDILESLLEEKTYGVVLRAKGIVAGKDGKWLHFDYVPGEGDVRHGSAGITGRLCVIGSHLDKAALAKLFGV